MDTKEKIGIGLVRLQVKNVGITKEIVVSLIKGLNIFQGDNSAGKSTILNSIKYALEGKKSIPADIIRHGFDDKGKSFRAEVVLETTKFDVKLELYKSQEGEQKHRLVVKKDGFVRDAPIEFLKGLSKEWNDPKVLAEMTGEQLYNVVMKYAKVDLSVFDNKIEKIKEDQSYLRKKKKELGVLQVCEEAEPFPFEAIVKEIEEINKFNTLQAKRKQDIKYQQEEIDAAKREKLDIEKEIKKLNEKLRLKTEQVNILLLDMETLPKDEEYKTTDEQDKKLQEIDIINEKASNYKKYKEWETQVTKIDELNAENKKKIEALEIGKDLAITNAPMPVPELSITEEKTVKFKNCLWENCAESDRLLAGAQMIINTTQENAIRYMVIHQGESILSERREKLDELLVKNNYTCLMQIASEYEPEEEPGVFYIVDGEVKDNENK